MKDKRIQKGLQATVSAILTAALAVSFVLPMVSQERVEPPNPISQANIQEIQVLDVGEMHGTLLGETGQPVAQAPTAGESSENTGESQQQEGDAPENTPEPPETPPETLPEEPQPPQEQQPPQQPPEDTPPEQPDTQPETPSQPETPPEEHDRPGAGQPESSGTPEGTQDGQPGESGLLTPDTSGSEGEQTMLPDLRLVLTWYKYGSQGKTVVCAPSQTVKRTILQEQLTDDRLKYAFSFTGADADLAEITRVTFSQHDKKGKTVDSSGRVELELNSRGRSQDYVFTVDAEVTKTAADGTSVTVPVTFAILICYESGLDLELELSWDRADGSDGWLTCGADQMVSRTIGSTQLPEGMLNYRFDLLGESAPDAELVWAEYETASGERGALRTRGGSLLMVVPEGASEAEYWITAVAEVTLEDEDGDEAVREVVYTFLLVYESQLELMLDFTWYQNGILPQKMQCAADQRVSTGVKHNQLTGGELLYDLTLTGKSAPDARILSAEWSSSGGQSGTLKDGSGSMMLSMSEGRSVEQYTLTVKTEVFSGGRFYFPVFTVILNYSSDLRLEMTYSVTENGTPAEYTITCENKKSRTAEPVYDSWLQEDLLSYTMTPVGDTQSAGITEVLLYQAGSGRTESLAAQGQARLLLDGSKTGENTFKITAQDGGNLYTFTITIPYKHEGTNTVVIDTNLGDGDVLTNETEFTLHVDAWSEDDNGNRISSIRATGSDTKLQVWLDGELCLDRSGGGESYRLFPANPAEGDENQHTLYIYAEDEYGNKGEKTIVFTGQRVQEGQVKGEAEIIIDMTVLGLGVVDSVDYQVLADEPVSYAVYKAVMGGDGGERFGMAETSLDWSGDYDNSLDIGFYLARLGDGSALAERADALSGKGWSDFGRNEEEILAYIDNYFGKDTGLAVLWRCLYVNGVNVSPSSDSHSVGEMDFTSESGWVYEINGRYPGVGMSEIQLEDGDRLTLRFTLAGGWDVGSSGGEGNPVGYCVTAKNGRFSIDHEFEEVEQADGTVVHRCPYCLTQQACKHEDKFWQSVNEDFHAYFCPACKEVVSIEDTHEWIYTDDGNGLTHSKTCVMCQMVITEPHDGKETTNSATCTEPGIRVIECEGCGEQTEEPSEPLGHSSDRQWIILPHEHYQKCNNCGEIDEETHGAHEYRMDRSGYWVCTVCASDHDWDCGGELQLLEADSDCRHAVYECSDCGLIFEKDGEFAELHDYAEGVCTVCGALDPEFVPEEAHQHLWSDEWASDEDCHWHECLADGCDIRRDSEKDGYGEHEYTDDLDPDCESCGWEREVTPEHQHLWSDEWASDEDCHWHECLADGCDIRRDSEKDGYGEHEYTDDLDPDCEFCGWEREVTPEHQHLWSDEWASDEDCHWHECLADGCDISRDREKDGYGEHEYTDGLDPDCESCGWEREIQPSEPEPEQPKEQPEPDAAPETGV